MALKFTPNPTFKLLVLVPVAGQDTPEDIPLTVKHLKPVEYSDLVSKTGEAMAKAAGKDGKQVDLMVDTMLALITGWEWTDSGKPADVALSRENMTLVLHNYPAFYHAVISQYGQELYKVREKN